MTAPTRNCPFYGFAMYQPQTARREMPFVLIASKGNQCALLIDRHAPCHMEINQLPVEWSECPYVREVRLGEAGV